MKPSKQLKLNLLDLGFNEISPNLFKKTINKNTAVYRDYRKRFPNSYAFENNKKIYPYQFKEMSVIPKIERLVEEQRADKMTAYIN